MAGGKLGPSKDGRHASFKMKSITLTDGCLPIAWFQERSRRRIPIAPSVVLGACPNSRCSILSESDSSLSYEQVFSPLEYRSDTAAAAECAGLRAERPCLAVYR